MLDELADELDAGRAQRARAPRRAPPPRRTSGREHRDEECLAPARRLGQDPAGAGSRRDYATRPGTATGLGFAGTRVASWQGLYERLAERTLALVDIPSVSRDEAAGRGGGRRGGSQAHVPRARTRTARGSSTRPSGDPGGRSSSSPGIWTRSPPQDNLPGRIEDGWVIGLGATDMKGGLAVMLELAAWIDEARPSDSSTSACSSSPARSFRPTRAPSRASSRPARELREADLAVVLEPTDNTIQAGCLGNLNATLTFRGESAHSARPWLGVERDRRRGRGPPPHHPRAARAGGHRRPGVHRGAERHADRGRCRRQRHSRPGRVPTQLPLRAEPDGRRGAAPARRARRRGRRARDHEQLAAGPCRGAARRSSSGCAAAGDVRGRAEAGLDARRAVQRGGHRRGQPRPGSDQATPTAATSGSRSPELVRTFEALQRFVAGSGVTVHRSPLLAELGTYPFVRLDEARQPARGGRPSTSSTSASAIRGSRPRAFIREALARGMRETMGYPRRAASPSCARRSPPGSPRRFGVGLDPDTEIIPTLGAKEAIFSFAQVVLDIERGRDTVVTTRARLPGRRARSAVRRGGGRPASPRGARTGSCPTSMRSTQRSGAGRRSSGSTTRTIPTAAAAPLGLYERLRRARRRARVPARLRRGLQRALVRRGRPSRRSRRPTDRGSSSSTA